MFLGCGQEPSETTVYSCDFEIVRSDWWGRLLLQDEIDQPCAVQSRVGQCCWSLHPCGRSVSQNVASKPPLGPRELVYDTVMVLREPILSEWKHHSQEVMIPNELNMTEMGQQPRIGAENIQTKAIIHGM